MKNLLKYAFLGLMVVVAGTLCYFGQDILAATSFTPKGGIAPTLATISIVNAESLVTDALVATFDDETVVKRFLRSFFRTNTTMSKLVTVATKRNRELVAVDIVRGSNGNLNAFDKESIQKIAPPLYDEGWNMTELEIYDKLIQFPGDTNVQKQFVLEQAAKGRKTRAKIERAIEKQCSEVLETGVVVLKNGDNIDFKRKAASLVAYAAGNDFSIGTVNPADVLQAGCDFVRQTGKSQGGVFNVIMGSAAFNAMKANPLWQAEANFRRAEFVSFKPMANVEGGILQGEMAAGSYICRIWTYPEIYTTDALVDTPYVAPKKVIIIPEVTQFDLNFAAVPQLMNENGQPPQQGEYLFETHKDWRKKTHEAYWMSAPIAVPTAVDQIYTVQVLS